MVNMGELYMFDFISEQEMDRVPMEAREIERFGLHEGDLLFARQSLVLEGTGKCSIVEREPSEVTTFESHLIRVRLDPTRARPRFYYYLFRSPQGRAAMRSIVMQVAAAGIRASELATLPVPVPSPQTQDKIAAVLSAYDDLIENNNRRITLLEETAQRIYREWFVDFRYPGHENVPLVDSELGPIPERWAIVAFTDLADILSGRTPKTTVAEYWDGAIPFFTPRDAPRTIVVISTQKHLSQLGVDRCNSELYPQGTVFITARGTVGKVAMAGVPMAMNQSCYAVCGREGVRQEFILFTLMNQAGYLKTNTGGATFETIIVDTFRRMRSIAPPRELIDTFASVSGPIIRSITNLQTKSENLRTTRELLLSRLISGEIDASDLAIAMSAAAA